MELFPKLNTARLELRKIVFEDLVALVKYANNKKIADHILNIPYPCREPDAAFRLSYVVQGFKQKTRYVFAIISKQRSELIGEISLHFLDKHQKHAQLAYWVAEDFWNQGLATEAVTAILKFGFETLELDLIYADCHKTNKASQKVLLKNKLQQHAVNGSLLLFKLEKERFVANGFD